MNDITLVIPAKNEEYSLPRVLKELHNKYPIIVIIEKFDFKTLRSIKNFKKKIIIQKKNGYGSAIISGLKEVKTTYACIFNADGSFRPSTIKKMLNNHRLDYDFIFASRYLKKAGSDDDTFLTFIGNKIFTILTNILFKTNISDILFTYISGKTDKFKKLNLKSYDFRLCVEIPIKIKINNFSYNCIPSFERKRFGGKKKVNEFRDGFLILYYLLKFFFKKNVLKKV